MTRVSGLFLAISGLVWSVIAIFTAFSVRYCGVTGMVFSFIVVVVAAVVWGKLLAKWLESKGVEEGAVERLESELRMLREAIERLRQSLES